MKQFALHEVEPGEFAMDDLDIKQIRYLSEIHIYRDTLPEILEEVVRRFNRDDLSDQNFIFIIDNLQNTIIYK